MAPTFQGLPGFDGERKYVYGGDKRWRGNFATEKWNNLYVDNVM